MRYAPERPGRREDLASVLKVCPQCLGDLVARSDLAGDYLFCAQCHIRAGGPSRFVRLSRMPLQLQTIAQESLRGALPAPGRVA